MNRCIWFTVVRYAGLLCLGLALWGANGCSSNHSSEPRLDVRANTQANCVSPVAGYHASVMTCSGCDPKSNCLKDVPWEHLGTDPTTTFDMVNVEAVVALEGITLKASGGGGPVPVADDSDLDGYPTAIDHCEGPGIARRN